MRAFLISARSLWMLARDAAMDSHAEGACDAADAAVAIAATATMAAAFWLPGALQRACTHKGAKILVVSFPGLLAWSMRMRHPPKTMEKCPNLATRADVDMAAAALAAAAANCAFAKVCILWSVALALIF